MGCAPDSNANTASCPQDLPSSCLTPPPSFKSDVEPILERRCWACHTDGGVAASAHDFSTYAHVFAQRTEMLDQVYACRMPPEGADAPTPEERAKLLGWFVCKAPNN
jgi:hypothetical protein